MSKIIDKEILIDILENEGCLIDAILTDPEFTNYESTKVISRCKNYHALMDTTGDFIPKSIVDKELKKLGMYDLIDIMPYQDTYLQHTIDEDKEE